MSPTYRGRRSKCLTFWYHMYGSGVGTLKAYSRVAGVSQRKIGADLFNQTGNKGDMWKIAQVTLPRALRFQVSC